MKYSYYQNKKKPPVGEVTDEEVVNIIRHDEKLAHMTLDIRKENSPPSPSPPAS